VVLTVVLMSVAASNPYLDDGATLFSRMLYEEAAEKLRRATEVTTSTPAERRKAFDLLARTYVALGKTNEAGRAFRALLADDAAAPMPQDASPSIRRLFLAAKEELYPKGRAVLRRLPAQGALLRFELVDPWSEVAQLELHESGANGTWTSSTLKPGELNSVDLKPGTQRGFVVAQSADGRSLGTLGTLEEPVVFALEPPPPAPPLAQADVAGQSAPPKSRWPIWTAGAAAVVFGAIGLGLSAAAQSNAQQTAHYASDLRAIDVGARNLGITGVVFFGLAALAAASAVLLVFAW
jgi:hypothetical protein